MNLIKYVDETNKFVEIFNPRTGFYMRSGVIKDGKDTNVDPFQRNFPQLIDVGIMGHCRHGAQGLCTKSGVQCYQDGAHTGNPNMSLENFKKILKQCEGKVFQMALGGRGDVDMHENFEQILIECRKHNIVPNFTTSGLQMTKDKAEKCKRYTGAVAVSWYRSEYTFRAMDLLREAKVKTNVHYVLGNNTIDEAIDMLKNSKLPHKINAIVFLLHKPVGLGRPENVLRVDDPKVQEFFELVNTKSFDCKIGFDSCSCPGIVNFTPKINKISMDYCEGARYSCYIDAQMNMMPCSFAGNDSNWYVNLNDYTIKEAWGSKIFDKFRHSLKNSCSTCADRNCCGGGCPLVNEITLCNRGERNNEN